MHFFRIIIVVLIVYQKRFTKYKIYKNGESLIEQFDIKCLGKIAFARGKRCVCVCVYVRACVKH